MTTGVDALSLPEESRWDLGDALTKGAFRVASYLTDPICEARRAYCQLQVVDSLYETASKAANLARKFFLALQMIGFALLAFMTTVPGILLRGVTVLLQKEPFLHERGEGKSRQLPSMRQITHLFWNVCCPSGYEMSDGGVMRWEERIEPLLAEIRAQDADVVTLCEVFDTKASFDFVEGLKARLQEEGYKDLYFNVGPRGIGPGSGILVASKFELVDPQFYPFPKEIVSGRAGFSEKGIFACTLKSGEDPFATLFSTHLQHSEVPAKPDDEDVKMRQEQMQFLMEKVKAAKHFWVVTGDFNMDLDSAEYAPFTERLRRDTAIMGQKTWYGDAFCAERFYGKEISDPLALDGTMVEPVEGASIVTKLIDPHFDPNKPTLEALSDHAGLLSTITLPHAVKV